MSKVSNSVDIHNEPVSSERMYRCRGLSWDFSHITQLYEANVAAWNAFRNSPTVVKLVAAREAQQALDAAKLLARDRFATAHNWRPTTTFTLPQLRTGRNVAKRGDFNWCPTPIDHAQYFRQGHRPWKPIAIISHEYAPFSASLVLAEQEGLRVVLLPESWYSPGQCNAVLYTALQGPTI